jgi:hypothetical protein
MTRHKSRVARIRRARRGTRKQSGGFFGELFHKLTGGLFSSKPIVPVPGTVAAPAGEAPPAPDAAAVPAVAVPPTVAPTESAALPTKPSLLSRLFGPPAAPPPPPAALAQGGGRKTRHRRRSPRHHRK